MKNKKYFIISEVAKILNVSTTQLRYLEKVLSALKVFQVKGRRYYTARNIEIIRNKLTEIGTLVNKTRILNRSGNQDVIIHIDHLIERLNKLAFKTKQNLNLTT